MTLRGGVARQPPFPDGTSRHCDTVVFWGHSTILSSEFCGFSSVTERHGKTGALIHKVEAFHVSSIVPKHIYHVWNNQQFENTSYLFVDDTFCLTQPSTQFSEVSLRVMNHVKILTKSCFLLWCVIEGIPNDSEILSKFNNETQLQVYKSKKENVSLPQKNY